MSFLVHSYNIDSGWKVGEFLSKAASEAEAVAEATKNLGVEGLTQFRHVVTELEDAAADTEEAVDKAAGEPAAAPAPTLAPEPAPHVEAADTAVDQLVNTLRNLEPGVLQRALAKVNSALGG
jgi:hypothetical protein